MRMTIFIIMMFCTLTAAYAAIPSVAAIQEYLEKNGAEATIARYFRCEDDSSYGQIEIGNAAWIKIATQLLPKSDACVSESLRSSLAVALLNAPQNILPLVGTTRQLAAKDICLPFMSDEEPAEK